MDIDYIDYHHCILLNFEYTQNDIYDYNMISDNIHHLNILLILNKLHNEYYQIMIIYLIENYYLYYFHYFHLNILNVVYLYLNINLIQNVHSLDV